MELPAPAAGTITEILAEEGEPVTVGQAIARMQVGAGAAKKAAPEPSTGNGAPTPTTSVSDDARISPVARRVAQAEGVDVESRKGSGPGGRITKDDVLAAAQNGGAVAPA